MRATRITGKNIKGQNFSHELKPVNVIVGDNRSGKSAIIEAIKIALLEYSLKLGKRASDTMKLASGEQMSVRLDFDNDSFNMVNSGKGMPQNQMEVVTPGILLDMQDYFRRTGPERNKFLFRLAGVQDLDVNELTADVKNIKLENNTSASEEVIGEFCAMIDNAGDALRMGEQPDAWFTKLLTTIKDELSDATAVAKQMRASVQAATSLQAADGVPLVNANVEGELQEARMRLENLRAQVRVNVEKRQQAEKVQYQRWQAGQEVHNNPMPGDTDLSALEKAVKDAEQAVKAGWPTTIDQELQPLRDALASAEKAFSDIQFDEAQSEKDVRRQVKLMSEIPRLGESIEQSKTQIRLIRESVGKPCHHCGALVEHWESSKRDHVTENLSQWEDNLSEFNEALRQATEEKELIDKIVALNVENRVTKQASQRAISQFRMDIKDREHALTVERDKILSERKDAATKARYALAEKQVQIANAIERHQAAKRRLDAIPAPQDVELVEVPQAMLDAAQATVDKLEGQKLQAIKAKADAARREQAKQECESQELRAQIAKAVVEVLADKQKETIDGGISKVMAKASALTAAVLGLPLIYVDGQFGYIRDGRFINQETFSGSESVLSLAGLQLAFAGDAPCKIILIDEAGVMDEKTKRTFLRKVIELTSSGVIDTVVVCDVTRSPWGQESSEVQIIEL